MIRTLIGLSEILIFPVNLRIRNFMRDAIDQTKIRIAVKVILAKGQFDKTFLVLNFKSQPLCCWEIVASE